MKTCGCGSAPGQRSHDQRPCLGTDDRCHELAEEGAFSTERAGAVPAMELVGLCYSGRYTQKQVESMLTREGGLISYLGTGDFAKVEQRIEQGDPHAELVFRARSTRLRRRSGNVVRPAGPGGRDSADRRDVA